MSRNDEWHQNVSLGTEAYSAQWYINVSWTLKQLEIGMRNTAIIIARIEWKSFFMSSIWILRMIE